MERTRPRSPRLYLLLLSIVALPFGCAPTTRIYNYRVTNKDCNCFTYVIRDRKYNIGYTFTANYTLRNEIVTTIKLNVENGSQKVLTFEHGRVRVSSERFDYQYNNKFIPFDPISIKPGGSAEITLMGRADVHEEDEWRRIAGERMTVTINGIRLGDEEIRLEEVEFVPTNPKLGD